MHVGSMWSHFCFRLWHRSHDVVLDFLAPGPEGDIDLFMGALGVESGTLLAVRLFSASPSQELVQVLSAMPGDGGFHIRLWSAAHIKV